MFRFTRSRAAVVGAAVLVSGAIALSGCAEGSAEPTPDQTLTTDADQITGSIKFAAWWAYANQDLIDGFTEKFPNVTVDLQFTAIDSYPTKIQSQAASGDLPDVFAAQGATLAGLVEADQVWNLNEALSTAPADGQAETWGDSFVPSLLEGAQAGLARPDDETWGVPFNAISVASIYNKDAYDAANIEPPTSFDDLLDNCEALRGAGYIPMSLTGKAWANWWPTLAWDQTMSDDKAADFAVSNPSFVAGFELVDRMAKAGCWDASQVSTDIDGETSLFLQQRTATFVSVPENFLQSVADGASFELGTFQLPAMEGKTPNRTLGGGNANVLVVNKDSSNLSAAVAFAKYLTSEETQTKLAAEVYTIPSIDIELSSDSGLMAAYLAAASDGFVDSSGYLPPFTTEGTLKLQNEIVPGIILGQLTPNQAAEAAADIFQQ